MHCMSCEHFKETCELEQIYASGCLKNCPILGRSEPIINPSGANFQIMKEVIRNPDGIEKVKVIPYEKPGKSGWYARIWLCYEGKGLVIDSGFTPTLPLGAIWFAWQKAKREIERIGHKGLEMLLPYVCARIGFDYSSIEYQAIQKNPPPEVPKPEPTPPPPKPAAKRMFVPVSEENLLPVSDPANDDKSRGDQMDLFAC